MIELKYISFNAGDKADIIKNVSLNIDENKFTVITGPNGGGKSTLARIIAGIIKPTDGKIYFCGNDITDMEITERARLGIGFAFQQPVRFKGLSVMDLLKIAAGKELNMDEACKYLSEVGLCAKDYINREINASLSGGELKRIEIATVIARDVKLAIFDEPEAGIDIWSFKNLINIFEKMRRERSDRTIIVISHQERILNIADDIIVIADGQIKEKGIRETIMPDIIGTPSAVGPCHKMV